MHLFTWAKHDEIYLYLILTSHAVSILCLMTSFAICMTISTSDCPSKLFLQFPHCYYIYFRHSYVIKHDFVKDVSHTTDAVISKYTQVKKKCFTKMNFSMRSKHYTNSSCYLKHILKIINKLLHRSWQGQVTLWSRKVNFKSFEWASEHLEIK